MPLIIRLGDPHSHGGAVISAAGRSFAEGPPIARLGDAVFCVLHGVQSIASASGNVLCEGPGVARQGDVVSCGASLISGAAKTIVN